MKKIDHIVLALVATISAVATSATSADAVGVSFNPSVNTGSFWGLLSEARATPQYDYITCNVIAAPGETGYCYAGDGHGNYAYCYTTDYRHLKNIQSIKTSSYVYVQAANSRCESIDVTQSSSYAP